jgi:hypothetical protein
MEDYVAGEMRPLTKCIQDVSKADIYIGIIAWRYGYIPSENNPNRLSITELEYQAAGESGTERLIFLVREDTPWKPSLVDSHTGQGDCGKQINRFRKELTNRHEVAFFSTSDELVNEVSAALSKVLMRNGRKYTHGLEISDLQVVQDNNSKTCTIDFRVFNPGDEDIQINRVKFEVLDVFEVPTLGYLEFSKIYDLDISALERVGDTATCKVAQILKPGEADRFGVRLIATQLGTGVFRVWHLQPSLVTNVGEFPGPSFETWLPYRIEEELSLKEFRLMFETKERELDQRVSKGKD